MSKYISIKITATKFIIKPLISGLVMAIAAYLVYRLMTTLIGMDYIANALSVVVAIIIAAIVYFTMICITKVLNKEEIELLPMGTKIYNVLNKIHIYK